MRMRTLHHRSVSGKLNVTPLIDVVMVLIVFYLMVGNLASQRLTRVDLPASGVGASPPSAAYIITVRRSDTGTTEAVVAGQVLSLDALRSALRARPTESADVQLRADKALVYADIAPVLEACRAAGLTSIKLVAQRSEGGS